MEKWQERVLHERDELKYRLGMLEVYRETEYFQALPDEDAKLLTRQRKAMAQYLEILELRIARFTQK